MKKLIIATTFFALSAGAGWAQDFYGYLGVTGQKNHVKNKASDPAVGDPDNEPLDFAQFGLVGSVGRNFANGFYGQIDLRFQKNRCSRKYRRHAARWGTHRIPSRKRLWWLSHRWFCWLC